jgi:mannose-6-phosphate isomerase-like protein (cupin superfamily)
MRTFTGRLLLVAAVFALGLASGLAWKTGSAAAPSTKLSSGVTRWEEASATRDRYGEIRRYHSGEAAGVKDLYTGAAVIKPGEALHKAHRHAEEEFLYLAEGSGAWSLGGKEIPAKKGDLLYVEPWIDHGLTNTGTEPLTFFVVKWNGKGVPVPPEPAAAAAGK